MISPDSTFRDLHAKARASTPRPASAPNWVIDPLHERFTLSEFPLGADGEYEYGVHTDAVFATERPWQITIDLPALTERHTALLGRAKPGE